MLRNLLQGLQALGNGQSIAYLVVSSIVGMFAGILPGLGGPVLLSIVLAFIYHVSLTGALCIFLAVHAASFFSSSITAILLNTPSHAESFAVTFDGFPMAQRGEAGRALGISAASTCFGGFIGCAVLVGFIQVMNQIPTFFHPPEYVALILIALLLVGTLGTDAISKGVISMGLGILIASIGQDPITGAFRYTFGSLGLYSGVSLVALTLGLFAIPQMLLLFGVAERVARQDMTGRELGRVQPAELGDHFGRQVVEGVVETTGKWFAWTRAGLIGALTGLIPGIGGFAANFMSYGIAQQASRKRELFGTGIPEGIIAPEGSSLAKEAGGLVPLLALGIPGGVGSALFLAALTIKDVHVGYNFTTTYPSLPYEMMWIVALGGLLGTLIGVLAAPWLARVTKIPGPCLVPCIMGLSVIGAFIASAEYFVVAEVLVFAVLGLIFRRLRYALAALVIGLVLGPTLETNIYVTHEVFSGVSFFRLPFTDVLAAVAVGVVALKVVQQRRDAANVRRHLAGLHGEELRTALAARDRLRHPYPLLALATSAGVLAVCTFAFIYALLRLNFVIAIMPIIGSGLGLLGALVRLPGDFGGYLRYRHSRHVVRGDAHSLPEEPVAIPERQLVAALSGASSLTEGAPLNLPLMGGGAQPVDSARPLLPPIADKSWGRHGQYTREAAAYGWFAALVVGCWLVGFYVALPAFCVAYSTTSLRRTFEKKTTRWVFGIAAGAVMLGITMLMFHVIHVRFSPVVKIY